MSLFTDLAVVGVPAGNTVAFWQADGTLNGTIAVPGAKQPAKGHAGQCLT